MNWFAQVDPNRPDPHGAEAALAAREAARIRNSSLEDIRKDLDDAVRALSMTLRTAGGPGSGNFGHAGRPGEVGGSASESGATPSFMKPESRQVPNPRDPGFSNNPRLVTPREPERHADTARVSSHLSPTTVGATSGQRIGGGHVNDAYRLSTKEGDFLFKPSEGERTDIHSESINFEEGPGLAEREVIAAEIAQELGFGDLIPEARMAEVTEAPPPPKEPPVFPTEPLGRVPSGREIELRPPSDRIPTEEHSGVIATTIGGLNADQKLDAWGRPIWVGRLPPNNLVNPPPSAPSQSSSESGTKYDSNGDPIRSSTPSGRGALIQWVNGSNGYDGSSDGSQEQRADLSVFDAIIGNKDRHSHNYMVEHDGGNLIGIDHGYSFPDIDKTGDEYGSYLRSYIMGNYYDSEIPDPGKRWADDRAKRVESIDWDKLLKSTPLTSGEREGVKNRARAVVESLRTPGRLKTLKNKIDWTT